MIPAYSVLISINPLKAKEVYLYVLHAQLSLAAENTNFRFVRVSRTVCEVKRTRAEEDPYTAALLAHGCITMRVTQPLFQLALLLLVLPPYDCYCQKPGYEKGYNTMTTSFLHHLL